MASLWRHPKSKYWSACWVDEAGRRRKASTKLTDRKAAQKVADAWEGAYRRQISRGQAQKMISELFEVKSDQVMTVEGFAQEWLAENKPSVSSSTFQTYSLGIRLWLESLGARAKVPLLHLSRTDILRFRKTMEAGHPVTGNQRLKLIRMVLKDAREKGHHFDDPFVGLKTFKVQTEAGGRRPFTKDELGTLLQVADPEWKSLILFGVYTGQRLGDLAALRWTQLDLDQGLVTFTTQKTDRPMVLPLAEVLADHLERVPCPVDRKAFLHPRAAGLVEGAKGKVSTVSRHFGELLERAGLRDPKKPADGKSDHAGIGKGRSARRAMEELSFHSFRHTLRSLLEAAGVPLATAMDFLGHSDKASSLHYSHVGLADLRQAAGKLPRFE